VLGLSGASTADGIPLRMFGDFMRKARYVLYWEDVQERLIYAQLDDYAWKLPERMLGYKKGSSLYIYHHQKLAAFYHPDDIAREARAGYRFYRSKANVDRVIGMKKEVAEGVQAHATACRRVDVPRLEDRALHDWLMKTVTLYHRALSTHYLTQPQFFERFEKGAGRQTHQESLDRLARARLAYTRAAWTKAMQLSKPFFAEYARRHGLTREQAESLTLEELRADDIRPAALEQRVEKYVLDSDFHKIRVFTGDAVDAYIRRYEDYQGISEVRGFVAQRGVAQGRAFVVSNENLDLRRLPQGMKKGMVLVVQNTWPEFELYYEKASAIVANEGGITSHGVVVAGELGIPCIVGTKIATHVFKSGDTVSVDANTGTVRILRRA